MNRDDLRRLARIRLKEARVLIKAECFDGAYYLCGYAVECALKACIAKATKKSEFPDLERVKGSYTHNLGTLVRLAGLEALRVSQEKADAAFGVNWGIVKDWAETARYAQHGEKKARDLYAAVADSLHGVMQWLKHHW
ncbi:HEPN domain protein [Gemmata sp. SH-PL17]|uniref:HEPN domain-containing protein n=1 Tax=Gemmata sp. SH-PL17 TaxID=1630693 RepID=UPI00078BF3E6|nr:HEPN domain-containing protein [Gemmata sp. SH-PL17]AMV25447.1 HEPN domain protein [Gemmata sp. SH-PL17]